MARAIDADRVKREIRKNKERIVISCKQKYVPLSLIYEILNKAPTLTTPNEIATNTNAGHTDLSPCDVCAYNSPSSTDGKPCGMCPARLVDR